ncbi:hypothetical protein [Streptomyces sp. YIM S03343]
MHHVDVPFFSPALVAAAREAVGLTGRGGRNYGLQALVITIDMSRGVWHFHDAMMLIRDGGDWVTIPSPLTPVDDTLPEPRRSIYRRRYAAAQDLRVLVLSELPFTGQPLEIPLTAYPA